MAAQTGRILAELELFAAGSSSDGVVVVARFITNEKDDFDLLFLLACHNSITPNEQLAPVASRRNHTNMKRETLLTSLPH